MNDRKGTDHWPHLVGLEATDEMPAQLLEILQFTLFWQCLLDATFPEINLA